MLQLRLLDLTRREEPTVALDVKARLELVGLMARILEVVFQAKGEKVDDRLQQNPKIKSEHLARKAIVYLRQSSDKQVRQNKESQRLQYDLAGHMRALGWREVEIIGNDLGASAAIGAACREGFERVLSSVALGEVGIVANREASRLSRTDKDWCRLVEVCQIFGTLIGDEQQVYDLSYLDDQLILGIKGTLSVVELKVLRQRLQEGQEAKARRGELFKRLPVGYVLDATSKVVLHPDQRVFEAMQLVFAKFRELWSVRHEEEVLAQFLFADQGRRLVIMCGQLAHSAHVGFLSSLRETAELQALDHSLLQFSHGYTSR